MKTAWMNSYMKNLLFISPQFHQKTGSNKFICELFEKVYTVEYCCLPWDDESPLEKFYDQEYDYVVCWQIFLSQKYLQSLSFKQGVFFPMFDACKSVYKTESWLPYRNFIIISFSRYLHTKLQIIGLNSRYIQYFPPVNRSRDFGSDQSIFFWNRRPELNIETVTTLFLHCSSVRNLHWHLAPDPGQKISDKYMNDDFSIKKSAWFDSKGEMIQLRDESAYYIAPRRYEGIGHSFLEAMASGRCVVAPDYPTMNEYITHGETGLLYNYRRVRPLADHDVRKIQRNVQNFCFIGHKKWNQEKFKIIEWINEPVKYKKHRFYFWLIIRFFRNPIKTVKSILYYAS